LVELKRWMTLKLDDQLQFSAFHRWVIDKGTIVHADIGCFKSEFGSIRGLAPDRNLEAGEVAISVPESELISLDTVLKSDLVRISGVLCTTKSL